MPYTQQSAIFNQLLMAPMPFAAPASSHPGLTRVRYCAAGQGYMKAGEPACRPGSVTPLYVTW
jgi:hypothetical protein